MDFLQSRQFSSRVLNLFKNYSHHKIKQSSAYLTPRFNLEKSLIDHLTWVLFTSVYTSAVVSDESSWGNSVFVSYVFHVCMFRSGFFHWAMSIFININGTFVLFTFKRPIIKSPHTLFSIWLPTFWLPQHCYPSIQLQCKIW